MGRLEEIYNRYEVVNSTKIVDIGLLSFPFTSQDYRVFCGNTTTIPKSATLVKLRPYSIEFLKRNSKPGYDFYDYMIESDAVVTKINHKQPEFVIEETFPQTYLHTVLKIPYLTYMASANNFNTTAKERQKALNQFMNLTLEVERIYQEKKYIEGFECYCVDTRQKFWISIWDWSVLTLLHEDSLKTEASIK